VSETNGKPLDAPPSPHVDLLITWYPLEHRFEVKGTPADVIVQLGMLDFAKSQVLKQQAESQSNLITPGFALKSGGIRQ
jgi:hypothetical protein